LQDGLLLPIKMHVDYGIVREDWYQQTYAWAEGRIFVNPFIDREKSGADYRLRSGRILGGARLVKKMPVRLELYDPSYKNAGLIRDKLNQRFTGIDDIAIAKTRYYIDINIPRVWGEDYTRFLELIMHYPVKTGSFARKASSVAEAMKVPGANCRELTLVWEAMGKEVLPVVQRQYSSSSKSIAFYSALAGLRLGDQKIAGGEILRFAVSDSPFQVAAIRELGEHPDFFVAGETLRKLLDHPKAGIRIASYEALLKRGDYSSHTITRIEVGGESHASEEPVFVMDVVDSSREYVIYATSFKSPKIVLFGSGMPVEKPVLYDSWNKVISIYSTSAEKENKESGGEKKDILVVKRKISVPYGKKIKGEARFDIDFRVSDLVRTLGAAPRPSMETGNVEGLGVHYGRIIKIINDMCVDGTIPANFYLQDPADIQKMQLMRTPVMSPVNVKKKDQ